MEYEPEQIELLVHKVASTLGNRLEGLLYQQKNILENRLNSILIRHQGQAESITPDEIEGAYEIATIHVGHPSNFLWGWEGLFGRSGGVSDCEEFSGSFS